MGMDMGYDEIFEAEPLDKEFIISVLLFLIFTIIPTICIIYKYLL
jgi:hypothetical protein